ncbi:transient receptor potential cation channel subfamily M member 2-like [Saccoglossus kowalevskii]
MSDLFASEQSNGEVKKKRVTTLGSRKRRTSVAGSSINIAMEEVNSSWIHNSFRMRQCIRFTEKQTDNPSQWLVDPQCQCGRLRSIHDERYLYNPDPTTPWNVVTHTQTTNTNAYGEIDFVGYSAKPAKYVRMDHETPTLTILKLLKDQWHLGTPNLLISVTGGAKDFTMTNRLKAVFRKGLTKVALSTNAWIITGGTHTGVMKHVGEAVRDYTLGSSSYGGSKIVNIGIIPWGVVNKRDELKNPDGKWPAFYRLEEPEGLEASLDPNHTHFIMVDNGTHYRFGTEIKLRSKIEKAISEMRLQGGQSGVTVPVVCVVLEGGPGTIETVWSAIMNGTPAVIVAGSGRAADMLTWAVENVPEKDIPVKDLTGKLINQKRAIINNTFEAKLKQVIKEEFGSNNLDKMVGWVKDCLRRKDYITIFELDGKNSAQDIDLAILQALLKANKGREQDQLKLALSWNRIDVAKSVIFTDNKKWKQGDLDEALHIALINNQVDFVKLFMENGVSLWEFLTVKRLTKLYNEIKDNTLLYEMLNKIRSKSKSNRMFTLEDVGHLMENLTDDTYEPLYLDKNDPDRYMVSEKDLKADTVRWAEPSALAFDSGAGVPTEIDHAVRASVADLQAVPAPNPVAAREHRFDYPMRELFMWSVLLSHHELANLFWEEGRDAMAAALAASQILKSMAEHEDDKDSSTIMEKKAEYVTISNHYIADDKNFVAHTAVQNLFSIIWYGKLDREHTTTLRLFCCLVFPPFLYCLLKFREPEEEIDNVTVTKNNKDGLSGDQLNQSLNMVSIHKDMASSKKSLLSTTDEEPTVEFVHTEEGIDIRAKRRLTSYDKFKYFFNAPVVTFFYNVFSYIVFLVLFSYIMLVSFNPEMSIAEYVLVVWVSSLLFEEIRQVGCNVLKIFQHLVDALVNYMEKWEETVNDEDDDQSVAVESGGPMQKLSVRMGKMENQMAKTQMALDWIIQALIDSKITAKSGPPKLQDSRGKDRKYRSFFFGNRII